MFDNTIGLALDGGSLSLVRVNQDKFTSQYRLRDAGHIIDVNIRHSTRKDPNQPGLNIERHNVELVIKRHFVRAGETLPVDRTFRAYFVLEGPGDGDAAGELNSVSNALRDTFLTNEFVRRLAVWES